MILISAACTKGLPEDGGPAGAPLSVSIRIGTKAGNGDASAKPVVNSVRILAFAGEAGSEKCVLNQYNPFGFTLAEVSDVWTVQMTSDIVIGSSATSYRLFAVLNEGGYNISASQTLTKALNDIDGQSTLSQFEALAATPVQYSPLIVTDNEPAFLMFARKDIQFTSGFDAPLDVVFDTEGTGTVAPKRSMAQIVIDKITSEPVEGHTSGSNIPKIFVLGVSLENVPASAAWGAEGELGSSPLSIPVGAVNEETGYYDRRWEGSVSCNVTVNATRDQTTSARYWRTGDVDVNKDNNQRKTSWSFIAPESFTYHFEPANANADKVREAQQKAYKYAYAGRTTIDGKYDTANDKKSVYDLVTSHLPGQFTPELVINTNFTTNSIVAGSATAATVSPDYWTVKLDEGYYVPENIASDAAGATCIKVSLALAAPTLNADAVTVDDLSSAPSEFISEPDSGFIYTLGGYDLEQNEIQYKSGKKKKDGTYEIVNQKNWVPIVFGDNSHIVYSDDHDYEVVKPDDEGDNWYDTHNNFHVYVDGFGRTVGGQAYVQVTNTTRNAVFAWNVPTTTVDLTIPVSDDFCVRRNTRYTITLHVDDSTYGKMTTTPSSSTSLTKSGAGPVGLTATVRIEKMNDDED